MLETPYSPSHHNVAGNGRRDGLKSERIGQSAAKPPGDGGEGSTTRPWSLTETVKAHECAAPLGVKI